MRKILGFVILNDNKNLKDVSISWVFTLIFLPLTLFLLIQNYGLEFVTNDYIGLVLEFVFVGMVPLLIVIIRKEEWKNYGFNLTNWKKSTGYGLALLTPILLFKIYAYLYLGYVGWSWNLTPSLFLIYVPVYGPLEAFFIIFSVHKLDKGLSSSRLLSKGLILTSILFGLMHTANYLLHPNLRIILTGYIIGNIIPALIVGAIFKKTKSILGSCLFWTVLNFF
ncbi:hypothetical protein AKJ36_02095 [candidate division MSBL1 archaeon SCGC-AAA259I07]|uniref:CAAX prenyl protease 2/Lysostaphin resistance protein A-like domain-containing protein n=1 Tax=candidate division MSBL1 archaeon SCGC-AAA259I07 TaxID=1698266 RepID=A0A133UKW7_9EURY|nr:hypothetical protein AKJ36_02095 [candidate division MSBL1 archaeon SCGC-AAA259I07]